MCLYDYLRSRSMSASDQKRIFSNNLKFYMARDDISINELSKAIETPYQTIISWLRADTFPRIERIVQLSEYFDISKADLIESKARSPLPTESKSLAEKTFEISQAHREVVKLMSTLTEDEAAQALPMLRVIVQGLRK